MSALVGAVGSLSPARVGLVVIAVASLFVGLRVAVAADGDVSRLVVAGASFADRASVDPEIHVFDSPGYDGQFYWRMAVDPTERRLAPAHGMRLDQELRLSRVAYPTLAWLLALGHPPFVVWSMVLVNVLALGAIAASAGGFCRDRGLAPAYGALVACSSGAVMALSRDLTEIVMVAGLVAGILAASRDRPGLAAAGWSLAVLSHEQALVVVGVFGAFRIVELIGRRGRPGRLDLAWVTPVAAFVTWQVVCRVAWGRVPILNSGSKSVSAPFVGLWHMAERWVRGDVPVQQLLLPLQLAALVLVVIAAVGAASERAADRWLRGAVLVGVGLAVSLSDNVWKGPAELRQVVIVPTLGWLAVLSTGARPSRLVVGAAVVAAAATAGLRVVAI